MKLTIYQADAFTDTLFGGNPAAVIPLKKWIPATLMQEIAMENNLAETAFFVPAQTKGVDFDIRWFTPGLEIDLCGHATLASAFILYNYLGWKKKKIVFNCKSGLLTVTRRKKWLDMDFPAWEPERLEDYPPNLQEILGGAAIVGVYRNRDLLVELENEEAVRSLAPDLGALKKTGRMMIVTAPGKEVDFVSRFFAPSAGIDEDPVTGSSHSQLIPFWSVKLDKKEMTAKQLSAREGFLRCTYQGDRVTMAGQCVFYMKGRISV
jgi:PhzF family phenazine biosynthesis protein